MIQNSIHKTKPPEQIVRSVIPEVIFLFGFCFEFERIIAKLVYLKAIRLVGFIIKGIKFINCKLMKFVEIVPPFVARTKLCIKKDQRLRGA